MSLKRHFGLSAAIAVFSVATVTVAWANWSAVSTPGGSGSAAAGSLNRGATPRPVVVGDSVALTWDGATRSDAQSIVGYVIHRYDAATSVIQPTLAGCAGTVAGTTCTESSVPAGRWVYSVTPSWGSHWVGAESPMSVPVSTETTPPVNSISVVTVSGRASMVGSTVFYRGIASGSFTLRNALADAGSGPASSTTSALAGSSTGWQHTASTVSSPVGGPYTSNVFSWSAATASAPTETVTGRDVAANIATTDLTFVDDSLSPADGTIIYPAGYQDEQAVVVTFAPGADAGSGIDTEQLQRAEASLVSGSCGLFSDFADVGPDHPVSPFTDIQVGTGCYQYRYVVTDHVGNVRVTADAAVAKVDPSRWGPALGAAASFSVLARTGVTSTGFTTVAGDLGVSPSPSVVGFPPGVVAGSTHMNDGVAAQAQVSFAAAYVDAAGRTPATSLTGDLGGRVLVPGVYHMIAAMAVTGTLVLDGEGDPNAVFIFQTEAALNTAAGSLISLINGAQASRVFWQVAGAAGTGALSSFAGTILAAGAITLGAGTVLIGRVLSADAVTMANSSIRFTIALPPTVFIDGGASAVTKDQTPTISGTTNAAAGRVVTVTVNGQVLTTTVQVDGTWSVTAGPLFAWTHDLVVSVRDAAGNAGSATQTLTVEINPATVVLGLAAPFSVLAATGVTSTGSTRIAGDLGVSPSASVVGFPPGEITGAVHANDVVAAQAQAALATAYADVAGRAPSMNFSGDLGGRVLHAGVYHTVAALAVTGILTLDGEGDPNAVFIFQTEAALNTAAGSSIALINGAQASNVFWQVAGAAGTGALSSFSGSILAAGAVTLGAGTVLTGRALGQDAVTMANSNVTFS